MSNDHPPSAPPVPPYGSPEPPGSGSTPSTPSGSSGSTDPGGPDPSWAGRPAGRPYKYATDDFFTWIRGTGLIRVEDGRWGAGVAGGVSRRWDIDPVLVRGVFVAATLFGGVGIVAYGLGWLLLPQESDGRIHLQRAVHGDVSLGFIGAILLTLVGISGGGSGPWAHVWWGWGFPGGLVLTLLIVAGIWWFAKRHPGPNGTTWGSAVPPTPAATATRPGEADSASAPFTAAPDGLEYQRPYYGSPNYGAQNYGPQNYGPQSYGPQSYGPQNYGAQYYRSHHHGARGGRSNRPKPLKRRDLSKPSKRIVFSTLGLALLAAAAILLAGNGRHWSTPAGLTAGAVALLVISIGVLVSGFVGRRAAGLVGIGLVVAFFTICAVGAQQNGLRSGQNVSFAGQQDWRPTTAAAAQKQFNLGFGQETLWLTDPSITAAATTAHPLPVQARLAAGHLIVVLPDTTPAEVQVDMVTGQITNPDGRIVSVTNHKRNHAETVRTGTGAGPVMVVQVNQGFGQLDLRTASQQARLTNAPSPSEPTVPSATPTPKAQAS